MLTLLAIAASAAPATGVRLEGSAYTASGTDRLTVTWPHGATTFDLREQVHVDGFEPADVGLWLLALGASETGDRIASAWAVRGESGERAHLSWWIGVLEPARHRLAGFPVARAPLAIALSPDGETLAWADADQLHVAPLVPPPRPPIVLEPDVDPIVDDWEEFVWLDGDLEDFAREFFDPGMELDLLDMGFSLPRPEWSEEQEEPDLPPPPPPPSGAQRLQLQPVSVPHGLDAPRSLTLSRSGHVGLGAERALGLWRPGGELQRVDAREPQGLVFDGAVLRATDAKGRPIALCDGPCPDAPAVPTTSRR